MCCQPCLLLLLPIRPGAFLEVPRRWELLAASCCPLPAVQGELQLCPATCPTLLCPGLLLLLPVFSLLSLSSRLWLVLLCWHCFNLCSRLLGQSLKRPGLLQSASVHGMRQESVWEGPAQFSAPKGALLQAKRLVRLAGNIFPLVF